jgi:hypothetical protein
VSGRTFVAFVATLPKARLPLTLEVITFVMEIVEGADHSEITSGWSSHCACARTWNSPVSAHGCCWLAARDHSEVDASPQSKRYLTV